MTIARARIRLSGRFDNSEGATVRLIKVKDDFLIEVRPLRRRRTYTMLLSVAARLAIQRTIAAEAVAAEPNPDAMKRTMNTLDSFMRSL